MLQRDQLLCWEVLKDCLRLAYSPFPIKNHHYHNCTFQKNLIPVSLSSVCLTIERLDFSQLPSWNKLWASQKQELSFHSEIFPRDWNREVKATTRSSFQSLTKSSSYFLWMNYFPPCTYCQMHKLRLILWLIQKNTPIFNTKDIRVLNHSRSIHNNNNSVRGNPIFTRPIISV